MKLYRKNSNSAIRDTIYSLEGLEEYAARLAGELKVSDAVEIKRPVLARLHSNGRKLLGAYRVLSEAIHNEQPIPPAGGWLIDNFHIIGDQFREIESALTPRNKNELPKIASGDLAGYPRVYGLALELIAHTDSHLESESMRRFVQAYQRMSPLGTAELWALVTMLRLVLVENLRRIFDQLVSDLKVKKMANKLADELLRAAGNDQKFEKLVAQLPSSYDQSSRSDCAFVAQVSKRLRDQIRDLTDDQNSDQSFKLRSAIELVQKNSSPEHCVHRSHQLQASDQVTVANIITSMRLLGTLNWRSFFESVSLVDKNLERDPIYRQMDFLTRNRYRHVIEKVSRSTGASEVDIAKTVVQIAREAERLSPKDKRQSHIGYYLIGPGVTKLEDHFKCRLSTKLLDFVQLHPGFIYFGLAIFILTAVCMGPIYYSISGGSISFILGIGVLLCLASSRLAINLTNRILSRCLRFESLPKLDLTSGIPQTGKTMVVTSCVLSSAKQMDDLLERLEVNYLGNVDKNLFFGLLTEFDHGFSGGLDDLRLKRLAEGIARLNQKYADQNTGRFFLFHRRDEPYHGRKIHEFICLLRGDQRVSNFSIVTAPSELLSTIRFVINLDAENELPRDSARKLVGAILHPLNQPDFDKSLGRVTAGYGVLQPRIGISYESATKSIFAKIFSGFAEVYKYDEGYNNTYTAATSEIYQNLFCEGNYLGKGLYSVEAFNAAVAYRPRAHVSHDFFEDFYLRTGFLTDVELLGDCPPSYLAFVAKQHRRTREDWQNAVLILTRRLSLLSRWKVIDNLRRSLVTPASFVAFILVWTSLAGLVRIGLWTGYLLLIILSAGILSQNVKKRVKVLPGLLALIFLAHQSYILCDAIIRSFHRKYFSKARSARHIESQQAPWQKKWPIEIMLLATALMITFIKPQNAVVALPFVLLWMSYPLVANLITRSLVGDKNLDKKYLDVDVQLVAREIARRTWNYFETFVTKEENWLPPDNHQEFPGAVTAHRTSPTNIGLYLLSLLSARDFGYVSTVSFVRRLQSSLATLKQLEQHEGHYLNWYDTNTLQALQPKYVSTVDSGNLAGHFLVVKKACLEIPDWFVIDKKCLRGLRDTLIVIDKEITEKIGYHQDLSDEILNCQRLLSGPIIESFSSWAQVMKGIFFSFKFIKSQVLKLALDQHQIELGSLLGWLDSGLLQIRELQSDIEVFAPWVIDRYLHLGTRLEKSSWAEFIKTIDKNISLSELVHFYEPAIQKLQDLVSEVGDYEMHEFAKLLRGAKASVARLLDEVGAASDFIEQKFNEMNFAFLVNKSHGVFSIGYSLNDASLDSGLYDLLGSECRLASFVAIAKGEVPQEHWFRLGRGLVPTLGGRALISWNASMFEYLMPVLVLRDYENTLLNETYRCVVARQIQYANLRRVPWGISEAAYNAQDLQFNYQYGPFGVPGLGLKRGLSRDLVISPYSTLLAAMIDPRAATQNLKSLIKHKLLVNYGFYESVDYTSERLLEKQKFAIIRSFMAHHQAMILVAINNVLHKNLIQDRFHSDPRVQATRYLLQERVPWGVTPILAQVAEIELKSDGERPLNPFVRHYRNPNSSTPYIHLLSNRNYSVMISTAGGGYSRCGDLAVTRWREDATRDNWGSFIFIRDRSQNMTWSTSYQAFCDFSRPSVERYKVRFADDKVEFRRRDGDISSHTQILVASEENVEIRHVTLTNHSNEARILELTSYLEPVLGPAANDLDHMAFSKLFIQTEFLHAQDALLAKRRKRSANESEFWGLHVLATDAEIISEVQYETDRSKFIGRGRSLINARALSEDEELSKTCGATLDPIMSLRIKVRVPANAKTQVAFTTGLAETREKALELADRYHDIRAFEREAKLVWTKSQFDLRHLNIDSEAADLYLRIAQCILYPNPSIASHHHLSARAKIKEDLWPNGISGDLPIVLVRISDQKDLTNIRSLLRCHEYLRLKGLTYDFIILNERRASYFQELQDELQRHLYSTGSQQSRSGGVFILRRDIGPEELIMHLLSVARISFAADESLKDQITRKVRHEKYPAPLAFKARPDRVEQSERIGQTGQVARLEFFNGLGGFSKNGKEYIIVLNSHQWTPAPWLNVIANRKGFGFQVSEAGSGFTWSINSQTNRLTPWSNDPVSDPPGEIIYLRDDETGEIWTPTPLPIRGDCQYTIKHGQGYTIFESCDHGLEHRLSLFVPKDDSVKVSLLSLKNLTSRKRRISVASYTEWVLGSQREKTSRHIICELDQVSTAIFARNPESSEFATRVAFSDISSAARTYTCNRNEFLGRNGNYLRPAALRRVGLSQTTWTGQDPCAVLQTSIELEPGEEREISILLGQGETTQSARELCLRYRDIELVKAAFKDVLDEWSQVLNVIQVKTPSAATNILMNNWLLYQSLACRYWSRSAFYQSGGAYGFRDQLQDCMAFVYAAPQLTREHILRASERQFKEGDVQHWWHPPSGRGIRTRISDDLLWLPFVVSFYVNVTGDKTVLMEKTPFLQAPLLKPEQDDSYTHPETSTESASIFEHCIRAINHSLSLGAHDLPLIGTGDWNDGMNRVGLQGKGESVWLGWFLYKVLADFVPLFNLLGDFPDLKANREKYESHMKKLKTALETYGWDVAWYKRAYFDDGTALGSASNKECRIDSLAQSWSVLSQAGDPVHAKLAMDKAAEFLIRENSQIVLLLTPPFDKSDPDPGYIKGYVPGVRENGGQYTHAAIWMMMAYAQLGNGNQAFELFNMLNPIMHSQSESTSQIYKIEPYVVAGDVSAEASLEGRGGWSWYTGSASWYYRAGLESLLGFQLRGDKLKIAPCIPSFWREYEISYKHGSSNYLIQVYNPQALNGGEVTIELDGLRLKNSDIQLVDDEKNHKVIVTLRARQLDHQRSFARPQANLKDAPD